MSKEELNKLYDKWQAYYDVIGYIKEELKTPDLPTGHTLGLHGIKRCLRAQQAMIEMAIKTREEET